MPMLSDLRESGCLTADTKIYVPSHKKICRIIDLVGEKGFSIFANHQNSNIEMKAKSGFYSGKKEVFEMKLLNGMSIKATSNHKFLTPDGWKPLSEVSDCKIALPMNYESDNIHDISEQEARLVGHFISNGSCLKNLPIRYCCNVNDTDLSDLVISDAVFASNGEVSPARKDTILERGSFSTVFFKPNFYPSRNRRSPISEIMRKYKLYDVRSKYKKIPDEFYFLTNKNTNEFLSALFSGDGTVYYGETKGRKTLKISYSSSSIDLIEGIQFLLMKVGIVSFYTKLKKGEFTWYNLYISGKANIEMYVKNIGFKNKRKNDIMLNGWEKIKSNLAGWNKYDYNENRTICFMPVSSIESIGEQDVYDIEVPKSHNFNANGIITHNSLEQDADSVMFLMRPEYYGMTEPVEIGGTEYPVQRLAICSIAKNRHGQTKNIALEFTGHTMTFADHDFNRNNF
jgi:replicative DNA helicase